MRLSFDTEQDTLDGALAVLSAAYGVSLTREGATSARTSRAAKTAPATRTRKRAARKSAARKATARKSSARKATARKTTVRRAPATGRKRAAAAASHTANGSVRTADVRAWASGQGIKVSDRGRLSASLIAQYVAATS